VFLKELALISPVQANVLMLKRLQDKWKVNGWRVVLILITFATGGSLTGIAGKKLMSFTGIENKVLYIPIYIIVITALWPFLVLAVSIPLGQFFFFKRYISRMGTRILNKKEHKHGGRDKTLQQSTSNL
jgi:hypothetical protein